MIHINHLFKPDIMINMSHKPIQILVGFYSLFVAFKVNNIDWVKTDEGHEEPDVQEGQLVAYQVLFAIKHCICSI